jgi:hypothetical protein
MGHPYGPMPAVLHPEDLKAYQDIYNLPYKADPVVVEGTTGAAQTHSFKEVYGTEGTKHDQGKARMSLLDTSWLLGVAEVLTFGEKKYAANNWRKGISVSRLMDAAARHQAAFNDGEDLDPESGKGHLYHASCCLMFASWMIKNRPDLDDRYKSSSKG